MAHLKNRGGDEAPDWVRYSKLPFVTMMGHHDSQHHPYPTVNVSCRPGRRVTPEFRFPALLLRGPVLQFLGSQEDPEILERSPESVDGCRALYMRTRYMLDVGAGGLGYSGLPRYRAATHFLATARIHDGYDEQRGSTAYFSRRGLDLVLRTVRIGARAGA